MIPVLGQPFSIVGYIVLPTLHCNCEHGGTVTLMVQSKHDGFLKTQDSCQSCKRLFTVQGFSATAEGQMEFAIEMTQSAPQLVTQ